MKYQIKYNPKYSCVPVIELMEGNDGKIKFVGLYLNSSVIHSDNVSDDEVAGYLMGNDCNVPCILSECNDDQLKIIFGVCHYPIEELKEVRDLEKQARASGKIKN